jgi:peroxiredoxin
MNRILTVLVCLALAVPVLAGVGPGDTAPDFELTDTAGAGHSLAALLAEGRIVVLEWFNPDCPFIKKHHLAHRTMDTTFAEFADKNVVWLGINSGAAGKQGAGLERNRRAVEEYAISFPILMDPDGAVGRAYGAKTTPHLFVITPDGLVAYAGAIDDDNSPGKLGANNYGAAALKALTAGKKPEITETKAYGCSVKYGD